MNRAIFLFWTLLSTFLCESGAFNIVLMGARRGKGALKKSLKTGGNSTPKKQDVKSLNKGKGQEITGVTLPAEGK